MKKSFQSSRTFAPQVQTSWNQAHSATIYFYFQGRNYFNIQKLLHLKSKRHGTKPIQLLFNLIFSEEIVQYSRTFAPQVQTSWDQAHSPLLVQSFPNTPRTQSEASWFSRSHNYKTKQTTFHHR